MTANGRSSTFYEQLQRHIGLAWYPISISIVVFSVFSTFGLAAGQVQEALANYIVDPRNPWSSFEWPRAAITFAALFIFASSMRYWTARLVSAEITGPHVIRTTNGWQKAFIGIAWFAPWLGAALSFTDAALSLLGAHAVPEKSFGEDFVHLANVIVGEPFRTPFATLALAAIAAPFLLVAFWSSPLARHLSWPKGRGGVFSVMHRTLLPALFLGLAVLFLFMPPAAIDIAREIGPVALVCISLAVVTAAGSYLIHFGRTHGLPAFALVAAAPLVLGAFGLDDNHFIRELDDAAIRRQSPTPTEALQAFQSQPGAGDPIIFVSAEGGGIRAAHFTSAVLARLADQCPRFARRIFAISGVSGGAVGAAAYRASLEAMPLEGDHCDLDANAPPGPRQRALNVMFARDHLSPSLAKQMFPELLQAFLPASPREGRRAFVPQTDRQLGLELSLEEGFSDAFGIPRVESPFEASVFGREGDRTAPYLLINATEVTSGSVFVASPLDLSSVRERHRWLHDFRCLWRPPASADEFPVCDTSPDFRLSTLAAGSARFPIVSPPGTVRPDRRAFRLVDGGYFDNSGVETLLGLVDHLQRQARERGRAMPPVAILHIDSNPYILRMPVKWRLDFDIHELQAVLSTREERVRISLDRLDNSQQDGRFCSVRFVEVANNRVPLRLGWILSDPAAQELQAQAAEQLNVAFPGQRPVLCDGDASRALHAANERADERALLIGAQPTE